MTPDFLLVRPAFWVLKHKRRITICSLAAAVGLTFVGCSRSALPTGGRENATIAIGVDLPLSGRDAADGIPTENAIKLAIKDANASHPVKGFSLVADVRDDAVNGVHNSVRAVDNFNAFITLAT